MKALLFTVALFIVIEIEAYPGWVSYPVQMERGNNGNPGRGPPWAYPQQMQIPNNGYASNVEWVCQSPKTKNIMIIASDDTQQQQSTVPGRGPWWQWHNLPPGHQREHHQHGNRWTQPIIIVQETGKTDNNQVSSPLPTTTEIPNNMQTQSPPYHGGEGSIDIRFGEK
ncbi:uncharacterized protein LOC105430158 [Pogonomyrmex barbatus]|uniref:Uncharacterized protein LOC105430158 n=1 Tax=Pogonomyrmex barbatus TaxID=144034 RepID=A0A6I9XAR2_9HYME|nr:uncharacterized protein LOC105430158 [Pogonomyrmex barbatus]XP_011641846.1 uncharacterized protein LOC105430158 [Pogonomyrmex barbatus]XP_011641847.1 uncharacterized protein LOC105430158 [Pogonomyrmex barbatus]XP_011641849.1 uncharacterized protein LOC105430158 [Pogonomyrmex barbatus]XP_011641850.1 uncharacterized protein LOC105430158 [Pogonomyrmex barbatus]